MTGTLLHRGWTPGTRNRLIAAVAVSLSLASIATGSARADCQEDITKMMKRRLEAVAAVNNAGKAAGGKLDPIAACPRLKSLAAIEGEANAYMQKNKDWCNLPGEFVDKMSASYSKTSGFAAKACSIAVQVKKMQQQQQAQQQQEAAPKLPAGPL